MMNNTTQTKPLEYYLSLKYPLSIYPEEDGGYTVIIPDLDGCMTQGDSLEEAIQNIDEARELWIETVYYSGKKEIPLPSKNMFIECSKDGNDLLFTIYENTMKNITIGKAVIKSKKNTQGYHYGHLDDLYISEKYRNQGYGTALLQQIKNKLKQENWLAISVHRGNGQRGVEDWVKIKNTGNCCSQTSVNSDDLRTWYKKRGFTEVDPNNPKILWCYFS